jgi:hypothetical protein
MIGMPGEKGAKLASWKQYHRHASGRTDALTTSRPQTEGILEPCRSLFLRPSTHTTYYPYNDILAATLCSYIIGLQIWLPCT